MFYTTPTVDGAIAVTCDLCFASVACPDPWAAAAEITHHRCDQDPAIAAAEDYGPVPTASSRRCTCWPAAGWPPAHLRLPTGQRHQPGPLRAAQPPPDLPRLPRGRLMLGSPCYRGLRLDGPLEEFHRTVDRLRIDTVPAPLDHQPPSPPRPHRHRRHESSDGQAVLLEEAS